MSTPKIISRPLSKSENFYRSRTATGFYKNFQVTATYSHDLTANLPLFYKALRKTILDYHILICNVFKDISLGRCIYHPIKEARLKDLLILKDTSYLEGSTINEKFMKEVNEIVFDLYKNLPLFKVILVGQYDLSVVLEHTIADGVVGNYFHEIFLLNLAYVDNPSNERDYEENYGSHEASDEAINENSLIFNYEKDEARLKNNLPPPIDGFLADPSLDYTFDDPLYFDKRIPDDFPNKWPGRFPATKSFSLSFKLINFSPSETKKILECCRREKVTLTSYIEAIEALTFQPILGDDHYTSHKVAIALRRHIDHEIASEEYKLVLSDKSYKILGVLATSLGDNLPPIYEFSWDLVREISANLVKATQNKRLLNLMSKFINTSSELDDNNQFFESQLGKNKADSVKISNLGFIKIPTYQVPNKEPWTIRNMIFSQSVSPPAAELMLNVISTPQGGMNFVLSYVDDSFDDSEFENFDGFVLKLKENILKYC